ncbi:MAG TPA: ABC transporter ATP-binding protein, partial [Vicinamibacteria bacterium]|nr:ABC transporter ATP-binding protein [Vicinamibacteria bacterium]
MKRLTARNEWKFFAVLPKADRPLAILWWAILLLRGVLPAVFAIAMGWLISAVERGDGLAPSLGFAGAVFVLLQVLTPIH